MPPPPPPPPPPADGGNEFEAKFQATGKFACPVCGGEARWDAKKQKLICVYCGAESPAKLDLATGAMEEHDLATALRSIPDEDRGWQTATRTVKCQNCGAVSVFPPERVGQRCDFCGSNSLVPYDQAKPPIRPESLLPFKFAENDARDRLKKWYGEVWFAPNLLKSKSLTDSVKGYYLPWWTFDSQTRCPWEAEAGFYYYETEYYTDNDGREQTRQVQHIRWQYASGQVDHFFDDELIPASKGVSADLLNQIAPFPTQTDLVKYNPGFLAGWVVEQYQIDLFAAAQKARDQMTEQLRGMCSQQVPGDTQRNLRIAPEFSADTYKHTLLPVWVLAYQYGGKTWQAVINGYTGAVAGKYPKSWVKIAALIGVILLVLIIIVSLASGGQKSSSGRRYRSENPVAPTKHIAAAPVFLRT